MTKEQLMNLVSQIGTAPVADYILACGHDSIDSYLAAREPKQDYRQEPLGSGDGTSPSEIEHYINLGTS